MLPPWGFLAIASAPAAGLWAGALPAVFVGTFAWLLRGHPRARLHPVPLAAAAFLGGALSVDLFQPFGLSTFFLAALLVYPAALLTGFVLDRPRLSREEIGVHVLASLGFYGTFALPQLAIVFRWVDLRGCDGCDPADASLAATVLPLLGISVVLAAASRYRSTSVRGPDRAGPDRTAR